MEPRQMFTDTFLKGMNLLHRTTLKVTGGRLGHTLSSMPVVELHHVGRKSGKTRTTMLTSPVQMDGGYVLVASKGGDDRDPDWYRNLQEHPDVELVVGNTKLEMTARDATEEERAELWPRIVEAYKGYDQYQQKTHRTIPVVICEPHD